MAAATVQAPPPGVYTAYPRDPRTDRSNLIALEAIGLAARDPQTGALVAEPGALTLHPLGEQVGARSQLTATGRPGFLETLPVRVRQVRGDRAAGQAIAPGTVRRNVAWPIVGGGGRGAFSSTANSRPGGPGRGFQLTAVTEYILTSLRLMLPRPDQWVVAGVKPLIPEGPDGQHPHFPMALQGSGWPVVAPTVPSFSSRVPLLRPAGLVSNT